MEVRKWDVLCSPVTVSQIVLKILNISVTNSCLWSKTKLLCSFFFLLFVSTQLVNWNELEEKRALQRWLWCHIGFYGEFCLCGRTLLDGFTVLGERLLLFLQEFHLNAWVLLVLPAAEHAQGRGEGRAAGGSTPRGRGRLPTLGGCTWDLEQCLLTSWAFLSCVRIVAYTINRVRPYRPTGVVLT